MVLSQKKYLEICLFVSVEGYTVRTKISCTHTLMHEEIHFEIIFIDKSGTGSTPTKEPNLDFSCLFMESHQSEIVDMCHPSFINY
jgi:hypothetical protein